MSHSFVAKTPIFEGPLHLLLELIEERKLSINEISLAQITDDYIAHVQALESVDQGTLSEFILVAATLILIKSKSLLPSLELSTEEEGDIDALQRRLQIYATIRELCKPLADTFGKKVLFQKVPTRDMTPLFVPDPLITISSLLQSAFSILIQAPKGIITTSVSVKKAIELKEIIKSVLDRVRTEIGLRFSNISRLSDGTEEEKKTYTIVSFLAILELVKNGELFVEQDQHFGDMMLSNNQESAAV